MLSLPLLNIISSFLVAAFITWFSIPKIIKVVKIRNLADKPGPRKIHSREIPTLGGIGIFGGFFISLLLFVNGSIEHLSMIAAGAMIIFFMGQKDDLINMNAQKKLFFELIVAILITTTTDLRITDLHGFLGIQSIPLWLSIMISVLIIVLIMNAYNLIDGIDGLAASIGILCAVVYGSWFWAAGEIGYTVMAAAIAGALCAFLPFNMYKGRFKIFMGDTGSLTIGLLLAVLTLRFNELNSMVAAPVKFQSAPAISMGILFLPIFDTLRVTIIRLIQKSNPFQGDNNHLHHRLLRLGLTHSQSTLIMVIYSGVFITLAISLDYLGTSAVFLIMLALGTVLSFISSQIERRILLQKEIEVNIKKIIEFIPRNGLITSDQIRTNTRRLRKEYETFM